MRIGAGDGTCAQRASVDGEDPRSRKRIAIRVREGNHRATPVEIEIEIGRRGAEPEPLAALVARHMLEGQGAKFSLDGQRTRIALRILPPEPVDETGQIPSNR